MTCIKTGAHVHLAEYNEWAYGDVHQVGSVTILRVAQVELSPIYTHVHFTFQRIAYRWEDKPYGTIIAPDAVFHSYEGVPV